MLPSFLLSLREGLEASLVVGIVLGVLRKLGQADCDRIVWVGAGSAAAVSIALALLLHALSWSLRGPMEPLVEGCTLFLAAGLLTWMVAWMNRSAGEIRGEIEGGVRRAVCSTGGRGVFALVFIVVVREGTELALFLTAAEYDSTGVRTLVGAIFGLAAAAVLAWLLFRATTRLNLARFFQVTTALLVLFAAGLVAKAVHEFNEGGWIPAVVAPVWNSRAVLSEHSAVGSTARALFGYTSTPSLTAILAYVVYLASAITLFRLRAPAPNLAAPRTVDRDISPGWRKYGRS